MGEEGMISKEQIEPILCKYTEVLSDELNIDASNKLNEITNFSKRLSYDKKICLDHIDALCDYANLILDETEVICDDLIDVIDFFMEVLNEQK